MSEKTLTAEAEAGTDPGLHSLTFEDFYVTEKDSLFRVLCVMTGGREFAEDILQDAFARVWIRWDRVGSMDNPTGYLYRTAYNLQRQWYRRLVRGNSRHAQASILAEEPDFAEAVARESVLWSAIASLPGRQRLALVLVEMLGHSSSSAGDLMGIDPGTVRTLVSRARIAIRGTILRGDSQ